MDDRDLPKLRACVVNIMAVLNTMKPGEAEWTVLGDALTEAHLGGFFTTWLLIVNIV